MEQSVIALIESHKGGQKILIEKLNKKLSGWANYHRVTEATDAFRRIDNLVRTLLLNLCEKLHPQLSRDRILEKYFYREPDGGSVYILEKKPDVRVHRIAKTILVVHQPLLLKMNPYLDDEYFEQRTNQRAIENVTGKYKPIWLRQNGKCYYCGKSILADDLRCVVPIKPGERETTKNLAYIHEYCEEGQAEFYDSDDEIGSRFDLHALLKQMTKARKRTKYQLLLEYFQKCDKPIITLTFKEIEKISGWELCPSAYTHANYWYSKRSGCIADCWLQNGYKIRRLRLDKKKIILERKEDLGDSVRIPKVFLTGRLPPGARAEMDIMFEYIKKKYGL